MPATIEFPKLLEGIPKGAWVALSKDEKRVFAYSADLDEVIEKAKALGEDHPIIVRVPETDAVMLL